MAKKLRVYSETVEKVPKQILGGDAEKSDLTECATINDLMPGKGQVTPENLVLTRQKDFSYRLVRPQCSSEKKWNIPNILRGPATEIS